MIFSTEKGLVLLNGHDPNQGIYVADLHLYPKSYDMAARKRKRTGPTPFSKILRSLMAEKGVTVRAAATMAQVGTSTIDNWRAGALPEDYSAVKRLANGLGVSLSFILTGEDEVRSDKASTMTEVFEDGGMLFDGYAKISIQRLLPRKGKL